MDIKHAENSIYTCCSNFRNGHLNCTRLCSSLLAVTIINGTLLVMVSAARGEFDQCEVTNLSCH
jgi:hypothetical protein